MGTTAIRSRFRDAFSRFVLRCDALTARSLVDTRRGFERAFAHYGLHTGRIRSDNGGPFASPGLGGLSRLSVWWIRLGIIPERIAPGHPEAKRVARAVSCRAQSAHRRARRGDRACPERRFAAFCAEYNRERPHEALGDARRPSITALAATLDTPAARSRISTPHGKSVCRQQRLRLVD
jgi:hypothetical protein